MQSLSCSARAARASHLLVLVLVLALVGVAHPTRAQRQVQAQHRPTIALVLGGGSARGIAHIGVLKWMEEHRIPIDYVVGTSMGGLIAGSYATGMTPKELEHLVNTIDWDNMFLGEAPYALKNIRRKQDARLYPSRIRFGLKRGFRLPGSLDPGQAIDMLLQRVTLPYYDLKSFDDLPTPFRTVATDVRTSEVVTLSEGPLWRAMRATMAIPGVFAPVVWGDHVFVDGGVLDNLPTDAARALEVDIVIAVHVGKDPVDRVREPADTYVGALSQVDDIMGMATLARSLKQADIVVNPKLSGLGSLDWRHGDAFIKRGYEAAEAQRAKLERLALSPQQYAAFLQARQSRRRTRPPVLDAIELTGITEPERHYAEPRLQKLLHRPLNPYQMARVLTGMTGSDRYQTASAEFVKHRDSLVLKVDVTERPNAPPLLMSALDIRSEGGAQFIADFRTRTLIYDKPLHASELRLDFGLGDGFQVGAEWYQPFGLSQWFGALTPSYALWNERIFRDGSSLAVYQHKQPEIIGDIGYNPTRNSEIRAGYALGHLDVSRRIGDPALPSASGLESSIRGRVLYDNMDSPVVPSRGVRTRLWVRHYFSAADLQLNSVDLPSITPTLGELSANAIHSFTPRDRLFGTAWGGTRFGSNVLPPYEFLVGGLFRMTAYYPGELRAFDYVTLTGGYLRKIGRLPDFVGGGIYLGGWIDEGVLWNEDGSTSNKADLAVGALSETFFGPAMVGVALSADANFRIFLSLAPLFR